MLVTSEYMMSSVKVLPLLLILSVFSLSAQSYIGTFTVVSSNYALKNVRAELRGDTLRLYDIKFSRFMPVRNGQRKSKIRYFDSNYRVRSRKINEI